MVTVLVDRAILTAPYDFDGTFVFQSGARMPSKVSGIYTGVDTFNASVVFTPNNPQLQQALPLIKPSPLKTIVLKKETVRRPRMNVAETRRRAG